jgi:hypothetical protein
MVLRKQAEGNRTRIERNQEMEKKIDNVSGHVVTRTRIQRQRGECVLRGHSGLEGLGGGLFEEVVRPPLGNCSINTHEQCAWAGLS